MTRQDRLQGFVDIHSERGGKTYAEAQFLKRYWPKKCLVFNYKQMDALIAYGVQPSQLVLDGEVTECKYALTRNA